MAFICGGCDQSFNSDRGLIRHQQGCGLFQAIDESENTLSGSALAKYQAKRNAKKRKLTHQPEDDTVGPSYQEVRHLLTSLWFSVLITH